MPSHPRARRLGAALITAVVALGGVVAVILIFQARDDSQLETPGTAAGPGRALADGGRAVVGLGATRADGVRIDADEVADLLERGNVVLLYGATRPPAALRALAERLAGPFDPALAASGQAVVLARRPGLRGIVALAWRRQQRAADAGDPALAAFAEHWLGRGAAG
jgi:Protein of unknown function (DUF3105)